jgi:mannose-6-phosphate isomerase-like protein (cupin superfamily)
MLKTALAFIAVTLSGALVSGDQAAPAAPAPRGAPALYFSGANLSAEIRKNAAATPDMATARLSNTDQWRINVVHRGRAAGAIAHTLGTELHHIVEGAGTLVTGGTIVRPAGGGSATIQGGETRQVVKGDVVLIPENTPHWYTAVEGSITYLEVRFNVPTR